MECWIGIIFRVGKMVNDAIKLEEGPWPTMN